MGWLSQEEAGKEEAELGEGWGHSRMQKTGLAQPGTAESWEGIMRSTVRRPGKKT